MECLVGVPRHVDIPFAERPGRGPQGEDAFFPLGVEDGLIRLHEDGAKTHHAAEIVATVHEAVSAASDRGSTASPVPIIESRVTSDASRSSLQPSVPAGRMGTTR